MDNWCSALVASSAAIFYFIWYSRRSRSTSYFIEQFFRDKTVLITGSSSGLGEAIATKISEQTNAALILASRNVDALQKLKENLHSAGRKNKISCYKLDLADPNSIELFCNDILSAEPNGVDVLINNAGISVRGDCMETSMEVHKRLMQVNYFGHVQLTQNLFGPFVSACEGESAVQSSHSRCIINISSVQGRIAIPFRSAYAASKHAFSAYFDCLKGELMAKGIKRLQIFTVSPGYLKTQLSLNALTGSGDSHGKLDEGQSDGLDAETAANTILAAAASGNSTELLLCDFKSKLAIMLRTLSPALYFYVISKRARKQYCSR